MIERLGASLTLVPSPVMEYSPGPEMDKAVHRELYRVPTAGKIRKYSTNQDAAMLALSQFLYVTETSQVVLSVSGDNPQHGLGAANVVFHVEATGGILGESGSWWTATGTGETLAEAICRMILDKVE